jgi:nucleoid-associated protein YgaU
VHGKGALELQFNPRELSVGKTAEWNRHLNKGARTASKPEFAGAKPTTVQMDLLFDDVEPHKGSLLTAQIEQLMDWMTPTKQSMRDNTPQPALLKLEWGTSAALANFEGFIKSCSVKYTLFRPDGTPIRATGQLSMEEAPRPQPGTNPTSGAVDARRVHVVVAGDSLHSVAFREYHDATLWVGLARFNHVEDPLRLAPGTRLLVPTAQEAAEVQARDA